MSCFVLYSSILTGSVQVLLDLEAEVQAAAVQARVVTDLEGREEAVREREGRVGMAEEELRERSEGG